MDFIPIERRAPHCRACERERAIEDLKSIWLLVINQATNEIVLDEISHQAPAVILERIAEHPNASISTLERLSFHPCSQVRGAVAENLNTPTHVIFALSHDSNPDVRYSIAENHNAPTEALELLLEDENPYVAYRAQMTLQRIGPVQQAQQLAFPDLNRDRKGTSRAG
jgi:hypothetical protein